MTFLVNASYPVEVQSTKPVAALLRELREDRGRSLRGVARELGVDPSYLSRVETGQKPIPSALQGKLADYYETDPELIALANGKMPEDVQRILLKHPELLQEMRRRYGSS